MRLSYYYHQISGGDDSAADQLVEKPTQTRSTRGKPSWFLSLAAGTILIAILAAIVATLFSVVFPRSHNNATAESATAPLLTSTVPATVSATEAPPTPSPKPEVSKEIKHCGSTPAEAREQGCVYDVMMQLWTPAECYDEVLTERYLKKGNWTWWEDPDAKNSMPDEVMRLGEHKVIYVAQSYHKDHCIFAWEKLVRALRTQGPLIQELISYDHVMHCRHNTLSGDHEHVRGVVAPTGYTRCAHYDTWVLNLPPNEHSSVDKF